MQARIDWVLIICGTQVIKKTRSVQPMFLDYLSISYYYDHIDGVAMGSPLAPVLANMFMGFHQSKWLNEYNLSKPKFYFRYVADIQAAFYNEQDSLDF